MKKFYEKPQMEAVLIVAEDVVTASAPETEFDPANLLNGEL